MKKWLAQKIQSGNVQFYSSSFRGGFQQRASNPFEEPQRTVKEAHVTQVRDVTPSEKTHQGDK